MIGTHGRGIAPLPALMDTLELAKLIDPEGKPRKGGSGRLRVRCPGHPDKTPSLNVWVDDDGKAALNCFAGCDSDTIVGQLPPLAQDAIRGTWTSNVRVLLPRRRHSPQEPAQPTSRSIEAEYPYTTETGDLAYLVRRFRGKKIRPYHQNGNGQLSLGRGDHPLVPYRLPDVIAANKAGDTIYIVEGEKDADTLATHGITATCNVGGAGKWTENLNGWFASAHVIVLPDNDEPGLAHAAQVRDHLQGIAETVRIVELPGLPDKGDVTDWLEEHTAEELDELVARPADQSGEFNLSPGDLIFDIPLEVESIWGKGQESLWAVGEPLMIYGPTGIGKTTLAGRLLLALIGVDRGKLLGYPIQPIDDATTVLYVAADRPRQAMRSLRRMAPHQAAPTLAQRLRIEHQRQIWASDKDPEMLYRAAVQAGASVVFIDSGKDLAGGPLKDEGPAKALMDAIQICIAHEIDVAMLHHPRKAMQEAGGSKRELDLDDVYGSAWLTAGSGSVLLVDGKAGSGMFRLQQLKAPSTFVDEMEVAIDYEAGTLTRRTIRDLDIWIKDFGMPVTVRMATAYKLAIPEEDVDTDSSEYKKVRRHIEDLERDQLVVRADPKGNAKRYLWHEYAIS